MDAILLFFHGLDLIYETEWHISRPWEPLTHNSKQLVLMRTPYSFAQEVFRNFKMLSPFSIFFMHILAITVDDIFLRWDVRI